MRIETERLVLRDWEEKDIQDIYEGLNNYDVAKNLTVPFPYTLDCAKDFIKRKIEMGNDDKNMYIAIELKENHKVIGGTNISVDENKVANGGIWLNAKYHGRGYGTEIWRARARFCFDELGLNELSNGFLEGNEVSFKMQSKIGYKLTGEANLINCPARKGLTKEYKTRLVKDEFIR